MIEKRESEKNVAATAQAVANPMKKIAKYSWLDEDAKVKIYIELEQFPTQITKAMVDVQFEEYACNIKVVDESGT